jgi:hypothetical protein
MDVGESELTTLPSFERFAKSACLMRVRSRHRLRIVGSCGKEECAALLLARASADVGYVVKQATVTRTRGDCSCGNAVVLHPYQRQ